MAKTEPAQQGAQQASAHRPCGCGGSAGGQPCGCGTDTVPPDAIITERNRYFTGKFMTARDFASEQDYHRSRHLLHNRLFHEWGIVCGLQVVPHWNPDCRESWVIVEPGIAIDCYGRELVLRSRMPVELPRDLGTTQETQPDHGTPTTPTAPEATEDEAEQAIRRRLQGYVLGLRYEEELFEYVPALYSEGACDPTRREANRIREVARPLWRRPGELPETCWKGTQSTECLDDCEEGLSGPTGVCLQPLCPCGDFVPLALIRPRPADADPRAQDDPRPATFDIEVTGRSELPPSRDQLTRITKLSWTHGGERSVRELARENYQLKVKFSRKLRREPVDQSGNVNRATGINRFTFIVQYQSAQQNLEFLPFEPNQPPKLDDDGCTAIFTIRRSMLDPSDEGPTIGSRAIFYITLKCNFILDCHDNPIDGDFLCGELPTGDGRPGGTFESWFIVTR
ncbi:MAG TPA: hypothetical protein VGD58_28445 [Herpetosiphonaceae bacterium]